jgi:hypothetical protein
LTPSWIDFLPDAAPDRRGPTAQLMTLRYPYCLEALSEFDQQATLILALTRTFERHLNLGFVRRPI